MKSFLLLMTGVVLSSLLIGCSDSASKSIHTASSTGGESLGHDPHPTEGPHGGHLIELGNEEFHGEITYDATKSVTVFVLDAAAKKQVSIESREVTFNINVDGKPMQFKLAEVPDVDDPKGESSRFISSDPKLLGLFEAPFVHGTLVLRIHGQSFRGDIDIHRDGGHHEHGEDDALIWLGEPREVEGLLIRLGHHGKHLHAGETVEPAVSITRDGETVTDAKVFNSLVSADGSTALCDEVATVFEPETTDEPAHYAQGSLSIPQQAKQFVIRYRVAAGSHTVSLDAPVSAK